MSVFSIREHLMFYVQTLVYFVHIIFFIYIDCSFLYIPYNHTYPFLNTNISSIVFLQIARRVTQYLTLSCILMLQMQRKNKHGKYITYNKLVYIVYMIILNT